MANKGPTASASTKSSSTGGTSGSSSSNGSGDNINQDNTFECNICLDTAKDAVISLCGHLFWWVLQPHTSARTPSTWSHKNLFVILEEGLWVWFRNLGLLLSCFSLLVFQGVGFLCFKFPVFLDYCVKANKQPHTDSSVLIDTVCFCVLFCLCCLACHR